jgi:hypothetical protein
VKAIGFTTQIGSAPFNIQHLALLLCRTPQQTRLSLCCCHTSLRIEQRAEWRAATCFAPSIPLNSLGACPRLTIYFELVRCDLISAASCFALLASTTLFSSTWRCYMPVDFLFHICESFQTCDQVRGKSLLRLFPRRKIIRQQL